MKKKEIIKANAALMLVTIFFGIDKDYTPSKHLVTKVDSILESYNTKKNVQLNVQANTIAETAMYAAKAELGEGVLDVNLVALNILTILEDKINLPKQYDLPSYAIIQQINSLSDINSAKIIDRSVSVAEEILQSIGYTEVRV